MDRLAVAWGIAVDGDDTIWLAGARHHGIDLALSSGRVIAWSTPAGFTIAFAADPNGNGADGRDHGQTFDKVFAAADGSLWAVGGGDKRGIVQRSTDHGRTLPTVAKQVPCGAIWAFDRDDAYCVAVEAQLGQDLDDRTVWGNAIWARSPDGIYVVGKQGTLLHTAKQGRSWDTPDLGTRTLHGVWSRGPDDAWVFGSDGLVLHGTQHGTTWTPIPTPRSASLTSVVGDQEHAWVAGRGGVVFRVQ